MRYEVWEQLSVGSWADLLGGESEHSRDKLLAAVKEVDSIGYFIFSMDCKEKLTPAHAGVGRSSTENPVRRKERATY